MSLGRSTSPGSPDGPRRHASVKSLIGIHSRAPAVPFFRPSAAVAGLTFQAGYQRTEFNWLDRLDCWLREHDPQFYSCLNPGATEEELAGAESQLGFPLPPALRRLWSWRNGQPKWYDDSVPQPERDFYGNNVLHSVGEAVNQWLCLTGLWEGGEFEEDTWWRPGWLPFLYNGAGDCICVDLEGTFTGVAGQVIEFWHDGPLRNVLAPSIEVWFSAYVHTLELGLWHVDEGNFEPNWRQDETGEWISDFHLYIERRYPGYPKSFGAR